MRRVLAVTEEEVYNEYMHGEWLIHEARVLAVTVTQENTEDL